MILVLSQLSQVAQDARLHIEGFDEFLDNLNMQGFLLKKGRRLWQVSVD